MLKLYNALLLPLRLAAVAWAAWPAREAKRRERDERLSRRTPRIGSGGVWLHGASAGESRVVGALARALRATRPELALAASAYTPTGRSLLPAPPLVDAAFFIPLDFPSAVRRLLDSLRPGVIGLVETELWPNLLAASRERGHPVVVVNGRLSPRRMARYRRLEQLFRPLAAGLTRVGAQSEDDAARFVELGVPVRALVVTGNVKYDLPAPSVDLAALRRSLGLEQERPVLVAGSTGAGEESLVLDAFAAARATQPGLALVLAPRHLARITEVERLLAARRLPAARHSRGLPLGRGEDVLLVDTVGDLASLYALAEVAFVGGSLVPIGGHNVLEPAAVGAPVLFGPHTESFAEPAAALLAAGGARRVDSPADLASAVIEILADRQLRDRMGDRAAGVVRTNRGALERSVALLLEALDARRGAERIA